MTRTYSTLDIIVYVALSSLLVVMVLTTRFDPSRVESLMESLFLGVVLAGIGLTFLATTVLVGRFVQRTLLAQKEELSDQVVKVYTREEGSVTRVEFRFGEEEGSR